MVCTYREFSKRRDNGWLPPAFPKLTNKPRTGAFRTTTLFDGASGLHFAKSGDLKEITNGNETRD
jgi:hypothetical protein